MGTCADCPYHKLCPWLCNQFYVSPSSKRIGRAKLTYKEKHTNLHSQTHTVSAIWETEKASRGASSKCYMSSSLWNRLTVMEPGQSCTPQLTLPNKSASLMTGTCTKGLRELQQKDILIPWGMVNGGWILVKMFLNAKSKERCKHVCSRQHNLMHLHELNTFLEQTNHATQPQCTLNWGKIGTKSRAVVSSKASWAIWVKVGGLWAAFQEKWQNQSF